MNAQVLGVWTDGSPEWLAARQGRVSGSKIGAICGWSKYQTSRADVLAAELAGTDVKQTTAMQRGHLLEPAVLAWLTDRFHLVIDPELSAATYVDANDDRFIYNPDALALDKSDRLVLLEAKTTSDRSADDGWGRAGTDLAPISYQAQAQWGMGILGVDNCLLGVLAGALNGQPNLHFQHYRLAFRQRVFDHMRRQAELFLADLDAAREESDGTQDQTAHRQGTVADHADCGTGEGGQVIRLRDRQQRPAS